MKSILFLLIFFSLQNSIAKSAVISPKMSQDIESACLKTSATKTKVKNEKLCACIAKTHFESALKEPDSKEGLKQLQWVIDYYQATDAKKQKALSAKPENLIDFDFMVVDDCMAGK